MFWFDISTCLAMGALGSYVARQKGRASGEGFLFGFMLGPLGVIVEGVLPTVGPPPTHPRSLAERSWSRHEREPARVGPRDTSVGVGPGEDGDGADRSWPSHAASAAPHVRSRVRARYVARPAALLSPVIVVLGLVTLLVLLLTVFVVTRP